MLDGYLRKYAIKLALHNLDALETVCVGVLAWKHPAVMHLKYFGTYLKQIVLKTDVLGFEFELKRVNLKIQSGFGESTTTSMVGFYTGSEHVATLQSLLAANFPMNNESREFFISFRAGIDDDRMKQLYNIHNNWLKVAAVIPVDGSHNINMHYNLGLAKPMSFQEFIRKQPDNQDSAPVPMDVENGGDNGRPMIIVKKAYMQQAKHTIARFKALRQQHHSMNGEMASGHHGSSHMNMAFTSTKEFATLDDMIGKMALEDAPSTLPENNTVGKMQEHGRAIATYQNHRWVQTVRKSPVRNCAL